jgi:hypothetical protein
MRFAPLLIALAASAAEIPTPKSVLGHEPGEDFYLANYEDALGYFRKLAASSNRIKLVNVGKTTQGKEWWIAFISTPENLAKLERHKEISRRLAVSRGLTEAQAKQLAQEGKAIIHIDGGLHATEVANAQHTIQLGYDMVAREEPEYARIRDQVILELWFSINPDGQDIVSGWYRQNVGTPYEVSPVPQLWQEYVGHDNNRDGYMLNMIESQVVTKSALDTQPLVFYTHHQTAPFPGRIYLPPFNEPISSNMNPLMLRWLNVLGTGIATYLDQHNMPGSMHKESFDVWYPGYLDNIGNFRHSISFFTETALYRYATPHFYTTDEFPQARRDLRPEMLYASPWKGGWWRLSDACHYMYGASMAVLNLAAKYRETMLMNRYMAARETIQHFEKEPPFAYVIPRVQRDAPTAAVLVEKLMLNGIEVHQGTVGGNDAWVIEMNQPFAGMVKELFEPQKYPDIRDRPYDVTGWTLPMQMGVEVQAVTSPLSSEFRAGLKPVKSIGGLAAPFTLRSNASYKAVNQILAAKGSVSFNGDEIAVSDLDKSKLDSILAANHLRAGAPAREAKEGGKAVKAARIGLYRPWTASMDEGWTRWIFEQFSFPFTNLYNADIIAGHLRDRFDVVLIPDMPARSILEGHRPGTIPDRYAGGIGDQGADELRDFVRDGGTLILFNNATLFGIEQFKLAIDNALPAAGGRGGGGGGGAGEAPVVATATPAAAPAAAAPPTGGGGGRGQGRGQTGPAAPATGAAFFCSGCLLKIHVEDAKNTLTAGLPADPIVMFERGPAFDTKSDFKGTVLARYPRDRNPLMSGYLTGPDRIQGKAAAIDATYGKGRVLLLGFRPQWRGQSHGTYKFFFNALYVQ